jgi:signal transduction histidine kinase/CheY-like chemotaxis protein
MSLSASNLHQPSQQKSLPLAKPKPYSIERRFRMMQTGSAGLALLLIATVLFWNQYFQNRLDTSLSHLHSTLSLETQIHAGHEVAEHSFWLAYYSKDAALQLKFQEHSQNLSRLLDNFVSYPFPQEDWVEVEELRRVETKFQSLTARLMSGRRVQVEDDWYLGEVNRLSIAADACVRRLEDSHVRDLETLSAQRARFSKGLIALLLLFAGFALLTSVWFRRAHQDHLWSPLEDLRHMVGEVRGGNLAVTGKVPRGIEIGSLVSAFLEMAGELREMRDSLEERVMERGVKLEQAQAELLQSAKLASLGQLVSGVAHEINNPLTSILGFSEVLLSRATNDPAALGPLRTIRDEALRLKHLIINLTTFARHAPYRTERTDLRQVLLRLTDLRDYQLQANNLTLHMDCPGSPIWVVADAEQLMQVMLNLVLNAEQAVKSCRERGDIWLACGEDADKAWFTVRDNGCGMAHDILNHIFEPFFTTRSAGEGTGLGLSVSYGIVRQHGGSIAVESESGKGSTLRVSVPLVPKTRPAANAPAPLLTVRTEKKPRSRASHALVIDDESGILEMVTDGLEAIHCRVTTVQDSSAVPAALDHGEFDLVLCDLKMPGQNGFEIYQFLRDTRPELAARFILMTGNLADAKKYSAELAEVALLPKPFTLASLRDIVKQVLGKPPTPAPEHARGEARV